MKSPPQPSEECAKLPARRSRTNGRACDSCHQRKIRCDVLDVGTPCTNCTSQNRPGCVIYQKKKHRVIVRSHEHVPIRPRQIGSHPSKSPEVPPGSGSRLDEQDDEDDQEEPGNLAEFIDQEELRTSEIDHKGRMCFIGTGVSNFNYLVRQSSLRTDTDSVFHFRNRQLLQKDTAHRLHHVPPEALAREDRALERRLLKAYFEQVNVGWPIVEEECFMMRYENLIPGLPVQLPLLNAIMVVACHVLAHKDDSLRKMQHVFFRRAKTLVDCRYEQDRKMYIQVAILFTWYSDGLEEIVANAWHWLGVATRTALGVGIHRDVTQSPIHATGKREYTRLWWILIQFDTMIAAANGRPQALNLDESDVPELQPSHFVGIPRAECDFVIHHSRLCGIISRCMNQRWSLRSTPESQLEAVRRADEELGQFILELPESLQLSLPKTSTWQATLHLTYNNFIILLHRPPPTSISGHQPQAPDASSDSNMCGAATMQISSIMGTLLHQGSLSTAWLYDIHALFTALIYASGELSSPNPLVSAKARRTSETLMASLRVLSTQWRFAKGVLHLFHQRAIRNKLRSSSMDAGGKSHPHDQAASAEKFGQSTDDFALRPVPNESPSQDSSMSVNSNLWMAQSGDDRYMQSMNQRSQASAAGGVGPYYSPISMQDMYQGEEFFTNHVLFPDAPALEFFLAGLEENSQTFSFPD